MGSGGMKNRERGPLLKRKAPSPSDTVGKDVALSGARWGIREMARLQKTGARLGELEETACRFESLDDGTVFGNTP